MGRAGRALVEGALLDEAISELDRLQAYELVVGEWARAMRLRLSGQALLLLSDELAAVASGARTHADALAARVVVLGGDATTDPRDWLARAGIDQFELVDAGDVRLILSYALERVRELIAAYGRVSRDLFGRDELSRAVLLSALGDYVHLEDELEGALEAPAVAESTAA